MDYLKIEVNLGGEVEKGCGVMCDNSPKVTCIGCKKFKWHKKCLTRHYTHFDLNANWENVTKKNITKCPECEARRNVPKYPIILK